MHDLDDLDGSSQQLISDEEAAAVEVSDYDFGDAPSFAEDE